MARFFMFQNKSGEYRFHKIKEIDRFMHDEDKLILFRDFAEGEIFDSVWEIIHDYEDDILPDDDDDDWDDDDDDAWDDDDDDAWDIRTTFYEVFGGLIDYAQRFGFEGNLWQDYLTFLIVTHENPYSLSCEGRGMVDGSINEIALHDFEILKSLFDYPLGQVADTCGVMLYPVIANYRRSSDEGVISFNPDIRDSIVHLSKILANTDNAMEFKDYCTGFYKDYGVGALGLHKAFRVIDGDDETSIIPIENVSSMDLDDLIGYEYAKQKLIENTESFLKGLPANNCLLYGDAGTGKSSSVKAIMNRYYKDGLRVIEIYKHQFREINGIISSLKPRNYKFILFMDDLSFEEFETDYKYLKAVIEGGLEVRPSNVLIYATSNRRHLIRESVSDKNDRDEDMHTSDTVQEKTSLAARFGMQIYYGKPSSTEFREMVKILAIRNGCKMPENELLEEANKWEVAHGGYSGRCARQFIDYILGREGFTA